MLEFTLKRGLGNSPVEEAPEYTNLQEFILQVLAVVFAALSIVTTIVTVYWFFRMRRSFRHHLIMILIQSDLFKALWLMVYAIVALVLGRVDSSSTFCQVSGFFTTLGVESSDFAVLMIAIHSALYIFKPLTALGEGGLYPYRRIAYVLWIAFPFLMASLAFVNPTGGYKSGGTSCHLPVRPFWYRLALGWIPRYIIFLTILGIDISIYFYIKHKFGDFATRVISSDQPTRSQDSAKLRHGRYQTGKVIRRYDLPLTPPLAYNRLIPDTRQASVVSLKVSKVITSSDLLYDAPVKSAALATTSVSELEGPDVAVSPGSTLTPVSDILPHTQTSFTNFSTKLQSLVPRKFSILSFLRLREAGSGSSSASASMSRLQLVNSEGQSFNQVSLIQIRQKIRQQLRFLFIYPLAYMAMWILPFVSHVLQYDEYFAASPPFILSAFVTIVLTSQSAVDCWIFNARERPWEHLNMTEKKGMLGQGLDILRDLTSGRRTSSQIWGSVGKSRAAMTAEATLAYRRRDEEVAARASEMSSTGRNEGRERSWWDGQDATGERTSADAEWAVFPLYRQEGEAYEMGLQSKIEPQRKKH